MFESRWFRTQKYMALNHWPILLQKFGHSQGHQQFWHLKHFRKEKN